MSRARRRAAELAVAGEAVHVHNSGNGAVHGPARRDRALTGRPRASAAMEQPPCPAPGAALRDPGRARDRGQHRRDRQDLRGRRSNPLAGAAAGVSSG